MKTVEETLKNIASPEFWEEYSDIYNKLVAEFQQTRIDAFNEAIDSAVENVTMMPEPMGGLGDYIVNEQSILKLKK